MNVDSFLTAHQDAADGVMGTTTMVVGNQSFAVVWNDSTEAQEGAFGGLEGDVQAVAVAQAADVANPKSLLGKRCTVGGEKYRISKVTSGNIAAHFALVDINAPD